MKRGFLNRPDAFDVTRSSQAPSSTTATVTPPPDVSNMKLEDALAGARVKMPHLNESGFKDTDEYKELINSLRSIDRPGLPAKPAHAVFSDEERKTFFKPGVEDSEFAKSFPKMDMNNFDMKVFVDYMTSCGMEFEGLPDLTPWSRTVNLNALVDHADEHYPIPFPNSAEDIGGKMDLTAESMGNKYLAGTTVRGCRESVDNPTAFCAWLVFNEMLLGTNSGWGPHPTQPFNPAYRIAEVPGKGKALLATRLIEAGETILFDRPVVILPSVVPFFGKPNLDDIYDVMLNVLSPESKAALFDLADCKPVSHGPKAFRICQTNNLHVIFPQSEYLPHYGAVFPTLSRSNHSCSPNASFGFDPSTLVVEVRSIRTIKEGEEITLAYCTEKASAALRQEELEKKYSFKCKCEICSLDRAELKKSDDRRKRISTLNSTMSTMMWDSIMNPSPVPVSKSAVGVNRKKSKSKKKDKGKVKAGNNGDIESWSPEQINAARIRVERFIKTHMDVLIDIDTEKLSEDRFVHVRWIVRAYAALGDKDNTRNWASDAKSALRITQDSKLAFRDVDGDVVRAWNKVIEDATCHPEWDSLNKKANTLQLATSK